MNLATWERSKLAAWYGKLDGLFPAERVIAEMIITPETDMVDIGIGGGRTTRHLAARCRSYVGLDYSAAMVAEATRTCAEGLALLQADAIDMHAIPDASADFVLFSFNGIDNVPTEGRLKILRECRRICRTGGHLALSTHNLAAAPAQFARKAGLKGLAKWLLIQALNAPLGPKLKGDVALLNDGVHRFGLRQYYIRPPAMVRQLADAGFRCTHLLDFNSGALVTDETNDCPFPYYLAVAA